MASPSARPFAGRVSRLFFCCFFFSRPVLSLLWSTGVTRSPDCISLQVAQLAALLLCLCLDSHSYEPAEEGHPCSCVWPSAEPGAVGATLFTFLARHSQRQNGGRRSKKKRRDRRRSRKLGLVNTTGRIPGNAPSHCWEPMYRIYEYMLYSIRTAP
ncbi:hypothetical protein V8C42DRAFT_42953 [Trichoderma barbatum]